MGIDDKLQQGEGRVQKAAGDLTDNDQLREEGEDTEEKGKLRGKLDAVRDKVDGILDGAQEKLDEKLKK